MSTFEAYLAEISPTGIRVRETYGWQPLDAGDTLPLPDGYVIRHETDADTDTHVNGWGVGLAVMGLVLAGCVLAGVWQLGAA